LRARPGLRFGGAGELVASVGRFIRSGPDHVGNASGASLRIEKALVTEKEITMALLGSMFRGGGGIVAGLAVGVGAAVIAPRVVPALRPLAKSIIKAGMIAYDQSRAALTEVRERTEDLLAEARSELTETPPAASAEARSGETSVRLNP
jgi:hypothetical protein